MNVWVAASINVVTDVFLLPFYVWLWLHRRWDAAAYIKRHVKHRDAHGWGDDCHAQIALSLWKHFELQEGQ